MTETEPITLGAAGIARNASPLGKKHLRPEVSDVPFGAFSFNEAAGADRLLPDRVRRAMEANHG